jgi:hypothetical protein
MQTISKVFVCVVFTCLLLSWVSGVQRPLPRAHAHNRSVRERHRIFARLRRSRGDNPIHHPVRPCKNAVLPPEDDDTVDQEQHGAKICYDRLPAPFQDSTNRSLFPAFGSRPLPTEVPRHQTLCILLI